MSLSIGRNNPIWARLVLEALASKPRLNIIKLLIEKGPLTASEISEETGTSLSTIMEHLDILTASGILRWTLVKRGRRRVKQYSLASKMVELKIDLTTLIWAIDIEEKRRLLKRYIYIKMERDGFPLKPTSKDIQEVLGLRDLREAIAILDLINRDEAYVVKVLEEKMEPEIVGDGISIRDLAKKLNIHEYWALLLAQRLSEGKKYILKGNMLYRA